MRSEAPLTVRCASCWSGVQYMPANGGRDTTVPFHDTSSVRSRPQSARRARGTAARPGPARGLGTRASRSASSGTTHGDTEVANDLPRNGPSGTYSQACRSRALQSLTRQTPNTCSRKSSIGRPASRAATARRPRTRPPPRCRAAPTARTTAASVVRRLALTAGPHHVGAGHDDRAGPAVVADRQVLPVRRQGVAVRPEDAPDVLGVVLRGVEVDVVGDLERQVQRRPRRAGTRWLSTSSR